MIKIYIGHINDLLANEKITLEEFYNYMHSQFKAEKVVCFFESEFTKNANVCFNNFPAFKLWWDGLETAKAMLLENIINATTEENKASDNVALTAPVKISSRVMDPDAPVKVVKAKKTVKAKK